MTNGSLLALAWRENVGATKNNAAHSLSIDLENQNQFILTTIRRARKNMSGAIFFCHVKNSSYLCSRFQNEITRRYARSC